MSNKKARRNVNKYFLYNPLPPCTAITSELILAENDASYTST